VIVVDLGCAEHDGEASIGPLIDRFHPEKLYGFDPNPALIPLLNDPAEGRASFRIDQTDVELRWMAAWTYDGFIEFTHAGLRSRIAEEAGPGSVPCFDFAEWMEGFSEYEGDLVVKMDVEGAEKELLDALIAKDIDLSITLLLIEWHDHRDFVPTYDRADLISRLRCPVETWH